MFRLERCFGLIDKVKPQIFPVVLKPFCYNDSVLFSTLLMENNIVSAHCLTNALGLFMQAHTRFCCYHVLR